MENKAIIIISLLFNLVLFGTAAFYWSDRASLNEQLEAVTAERDAAQTNSSALEEDIQKLNNKLKFLE